MAEILGPCTLPVHHAEAGWIVENGTVAYGHDVGQLGVSTHPGKAIVVIAEVAVLQLQHGNVSVRAWGESAQLRMMNFLRRIHRGLLNDFLQRFSHNQEPRHNIRKTELRYVAQVQVCGD